MMKARIAVTVTIGVHAACMTGCILFEDRNLPCETTSTCPSPPDFGLEAETGRDVSVDTFVESARGDAVADAGSDSRTSAEADAVADTTEVVPDDVAASDGPSADREVCDLSKSPASAPCTVSEQYGVFVSPLASDAGANGTREAPYGSLREAMVAANADRKRIYVCDDGTGYAEALTAGPSLDGAKLFGGFECSGWTYTGRRSKWTAPSSPVLTITKLSAGIVVEDFEIVAPNASSPGESSTGVVVSESAGVILRRVKVSAGKGKDGTNGDNGGGPSKEVAATGVQGNNGARACTSDPRGGLPATTMCNGVATSPGGGGGDGALNAASKGRDGDDGSPAYSGGKGGPGEPLNGSWDCSTANGQAGTSGPDGSSGRNASGLGTLTTSGWSADAAGDGTTGQPGQGGGGGGGAKAPLACTAVDGGSLSPTGASGGSGGGGGCGGHAGKGGMAGGSSIALVSIGSEVELDSCELTANDAGNGGNGGLGQPGGSGGAPGVGGTKGNTSAKDACSGGQGGQGGNGGAGGGGMGGHSIGVAYRGKAPVGLDSSAAAFGAKGTGGQPGSGSTGKGDDGVALRWQSFDLSDAGK